MNTHPVDQYLSTITRRQLFQRVGLGVGGFALANLLNNDLRRCENPFCSLAPKAKNVIYFHLVGAPSHLDLFDYKPELRKETGALPQGNVRGKTACLYPFPSTLLGTSKESNTNLKNVENPVSDFQFTPHLQTVADDMCFIRTLHTDSSITHLLRCLCKPGSTFRSTQPWAWTNYGIGSPNKDLPGFVVMVTGHIPVPETVFSEWISSSVYQGIEFRGKGDPFFFFPIPRE